MYAEQQTQTAARDASVSLVRAGAAGFEPPGPAAPSLTLRDSKGREFIIDAADEETVRTKNWLVDSTKRRVLWSDGRRSVKLHRFLLTAEPGQIVDHINGDGLDNRRCNLRFCSKAENTRNQKKSVGAVPFKGVMVRGVRFIAAIYVAGRTKWLGTFDDPAAAAHAYDAAAREHFGEFACTNFPQGRERPALPPVQHDGALYAESEA